MLRDEVGAPGVDLTPKICELGVEAADLRVHGLEPRAGAVEPGLQRLALAPGRRLKGVRRPAPRGPDWIASATRF